MRLSPFRGVFPSLLAGCLATAASQAAITWGSAVTVSADTDVSTAGTLAYAHRFDLSTGVTSNVVVNGVTFTSITGSGSTAAPYTHSNFTFAPVTSGTLQSTNHQFTNGRSAGITATPTFTTNYLSLLGGLIFAGGANGSSVSGRRNAFSLTLDGLQAGQEYSIQMWFNDSRLGTGNRQGEILSSPSNITVDYNNTNGAGGFGQHVTGTFVATGDEETFTFRAFADDNVGAQLNAFQLRLIPEPSSVLLGSLAMIALGLRRKR